VDTFLRDNLIKIILIIITFISFLVLFSVLNIDFNPHVEKEIKKVVVIEK